MTSTCCAETAVYSIGDLLRLSITVVPIVEGEVISAPPDNLIKVKLPDGTEIDLSGNVVQDTFTAEEYQAHVDYQPDQAGWYSTQWTCSNSVIVSGAGRFLVNAQVA